jgi:hypothetical protein
MERLDRGRMDKFPSINPRSEEKDDNYFGEQGRDMFYQRCLWLKQQGEIVSAQSRYSESSASFDNSKDTLVFSRKGWKGHKKLRNDDTDRNGFEDDSSVSTMHTNHSVSSSATKLKHSIYSHSNSRTPERSPNRERAIDGGSNNKDKGKTYTKANPHLYESNLKTLSPRTRFISSCMKEGLNPRASLLIRKSTTRNLKLPHMCIGDQVAYLLAESLCDLTDIEAIDLTDNVLTDASLHPLMHSICSIPNLHVLNLSSNTIGIIRVSVRVKVYY